MYRDAHQPWAGMLRAIPVSLLNRGPAQLKCPQTAEGFLFPSQVVVCVGTQGGEGTTPGLEVPPKVGGPEQSELGVRGAWTVAPVQTQELFPAKTVYAAGGDRSAGQVSRLV